MIDVSQMADFTWWVWYTGHPELMCDGYTLDSAVKHLEGMK